MVRKAGQIEYGIGQAINGEMESMTDDFGVLRVVHKNGGAFDVRLNAPLDIRMWVNAVRAAGYYLNEHLYIPEDMIAFAQIIPPGVPDSLMAQMESVGATKQ